MARLSIRGWVVSAIDYRYCVGRVGDTLRAWGYLPKCHDLKIFRGNFEDVANGVKRFEIRRDDRGFQSHQEVVLSEWQPELEEYTGRYCIAEITCITDFEQKDGFVVFGINVKYVFWG